MHVISVFLSLGTLKKTSHAAEPTEEGVTRESTKAPLSKLFCASQHVLATNCKSVYNTLSVRKGQEDKAGHSDSVSQMPPPLHCWVTLILRERALLILAKVA